MTTIKGCVSKSLNSQLFNQNLCQYCLQMNNYVVHQQLKGDVAKFVAFWNQL